MILLFFLFCSFITYRWIIPGPVEKCDLFDLDRNTCLDRQHDSPSFCGLVVSATQLGTEPVVSSTSWQCRIYIPCSFEPTITWNPFGVDLGTYGLTPKLCFKKSCTYKREVWLHGQTTEHLKDWLISIHTICNNSSVNFFDLLNLSNILVNISAWEVRGHPQGTPGTEERNQRRTHGSRRWCLRHFEHGSVEENRS